MRNTLFRKASLDSISSPEQLNDYIKVSNPSIWMTLIALFILLTAVLVWSITGNMPTTIHTRGVIYGGNALCYVDTENAGTIKAGQAVKIQVFNLNETISGHVDKVRAVPMSASEIAADLKSDYLVQELTQDGFAVKVAVSLDGTIGITDGTILDISIVTDTVRPIDFLLN